MSTPPSAPAPAFSITAYPSLHPTTVAAIEAARRGEVVELGSPWEAIAELNRDN